MTLPGTMAIISSASTLPPSTWTWHREIEYRIEVVSIYPHGPRELRTTLATTATRRDFLSIFQLSPRRRALANNSASDATPITVFEYAMMAEICPRSPRASLHSTWCGKHWNVTSAE